MIQIGGLILLICGILTVVSPGKFAVDPQNKKRVAKGQPPMNEEEYAIALAKARKSGIFLAVAGAVMFAAVTFIPV